MATENKKVDTGERKPLEDLDQIKTELTETPPEPAKPKGKKRGPYKKRAKKAEPVEPEIENPIDAKALENVYQLMFATLASKNGQPHWLLTQEESTALAEATGAVLDKYAPVLAGFLPELTLLVTAGGIIGMKFFQSVQLAKMAEAEKEKTDADGREPNPSS